MNIAIITSIKAPYRTIQLEEICKKTYINMTVYYTNRGKEDREWETRNSNYFEEIYLKKFKVFDKIGTLNKGLKDIVKNNDVIVLGGYEKPTYIIMSLLCRFYKKKYIIIFDGISTNRLYKKENKVKWLIKNLVIKNSSAIWANGTVSKRYFNELFNYPLAKIYNQYLTVDGNKIKNIGKNRYDIRKELRNKYGINEDEKVLHYSGRLVEVKNIKAVIEALSKINNQKITLFITGDGELRDELQALAIKYGIKMIIAGFIDNQEELFKHYYLSDAFILPSIYEPWGLVVNEAIFAGLPILVSNNCGCSLDLVRENENGFTFNPYDIKDIADKIEYILFNNSKLIKNNSNQIINEWSIENSAKTFNRILKDIYTMEKI